MVLKSCKMKSCGFDLACFHVQLEFRKGLRMELTGFLRVKKEFN